MDSMDMNKVEFLFRGKKLVDLEIQSYLPLNLFIGLSIIILNKNKYFSFGLNFGANKNKDHIEGNKKKMKSISEKGEEVSNLAPASSKEEEKDSEPKVHKVDFTYDFFNESKKDDVDQFNNPLSKSSSILESDKVSDQTIKFYEESIQDLNHVLSEKDDLINKKQKDIDMQLKELESLRALITSKDMIINNLKKDAEFSESQNSIEKIKFSNDLMSQSQKLSDSESKLSEVSKKLTYSLARNKELEEELDKSNKIAQDLQIQLNRKDEELINLNNSLNNNKEMQSKDKNIQEKLVNELKNEIDKLKNQIESPANSSHLENAPISSNELFKKDENDIQSIIGDLSEKGLSHIDKDTVTTFLTIIENKIFKSEISFNTTNITYRTQDNSQAMHDLRQEIDALQRDSYKKETEIKRLNEQIRVYEKHFFDNNLKPPQEYEFSNVKLSELQASLSNNRNKIHAMLEKANQRRALNNSSTPTSPQYSRSNSRITSPRSSEKSPNNSPYNSFHSLSELNLNKSMMSSTSSYSSTHESIEARSSYSSSIQSNSDISYSSSSKTTTRTTKQSKTITSSPKK